MGESYRDTITDPCIGSVISKDISSCIEARAIRASKFLERRFITDVCVIF